MSFPEVICAVRDDEDAPVIEAAAALGDAVKMPVRLVHVSMTPRAPGDLLSGTTPPVLPVTAGEMAGAAVALAPPPDLRRLAAASGRPDLPGDVVEGVAVDTLRDLGAAGRTGWLVVGDGGRGAFTALLHGSVARRLLDAPGRPLVVVPRTGRRAPLTGTEPVACLVGDGHATAQCARVASELAVALHTRVVLLHARAARSGEGDVRREFAAARACLDPSLTVDEVAVSGSHFAAVPETCRAVGARVLVVDRASRGAFGAAVVPTTTHELLADADLPVVVARAA